MSITIAANHQVTKQGEVGTGMYIIISGWSDMESTDTDGIVKLGPGQSFGEEVVLGVLENYEYTITCLEKSRMEMILESEFLDLFQTMPNEMRRMRQNMFEWHPLRSRLTSMPQSSQQTKGYLKSSQPSVGGTISGIGGLTTTIDSDGLFRSSKLSSV